MAKKNKKKNNLSTKKNSMLGMGGKLGLSGFGQEGDELVLRINQKNMVAKCKSGSVKQSITIYGTGRCVYTYSEWNDFNGDSEKNHLLLEDESCVWDEDDE